MQFELLLFVILLQIIIRKIKPSGRVYKQSIIGRVYGPWLYVFGWESVEVISLEFFRKFRWWATYRKVGGSVALSWAIFPQSVLELDPLVFFFFFERGLFILTEGSIFREIYRKRRSLKCSSLTGLQMVNQEINGPICSSTSRQILLFS